jgi:hypothetical protein
MKGITADNFYNHFDLLGVLLVPEPMRANSRDHCTVTFSGPANLRNTSQEQIQAGDDVFWLHPEDEPDIARKCQLSTMSKCDVAITVPWRTFKQYLARKGFGPNTHEYIRYISYHFVGVCSVSGGPGMPCLVDLR